MSKTDKQKFNEIGEKILKGMTLAFDRLLEKKAKEDGYLVFSENGKIVHVSARELYEKRKIEKGAKAGQPGN